MPANRYVSAVNVQPIRDLYSAAPSQPFEVVLTNGATVRIVHPEFLSFAPDYRTIHVYDLDGSSKHIDVKLIIALNELKNGSGPRKKKR